MAEYLFKTDNRITNCSDCSFVIDIKDREGIDENGKPVILKGCPFLRELVDLYFTSRHKFCPLVELPTPHGRLVDIDKMIAECREKPFPVYISSSEELADVLEEYVNLDKIGHTVIVPASEETDKDCQSCFWYQQRGCQFQCVHEHGECNGERFEQAEP